MPKFSQPDASLISEFNPLETEFLVSEIFHSIQGEGLRAGERCVFIRLHGCSLRCSWCDTPYALDKRSGGIIMTGKEIIEKAKTFDCKFIEFTGGEPLEQIAVHGLMSYFCDDGYTVAIETGGHIDISHIDSRVIRIVDVKCPDSKMSTLNHLENLRVITKTDEIKFVLASRSDYEWAKNIILEYDLTDVCGAVLMSCVFDALPFKTLAEWILEDRLNVRMQLQMHKFIWDPSMRGV
ncbi:MAG: radical SAM protein [Candidatus Kapaibacteriota bacterium]